MQRLESNLYTDPQATREAGYCPVCKRCLYAPSMLCTRCERDAL